MNKVCNHQNIRIVTSDYEDHGCWVDRSVTTARCIECGYGVSDEYNYWAYLEFIKGKTVVSRN